MLQNFLPWLSWIHMNRVLDVALSREHDEHFRIGHLKAKLWTDHDFLEQCFCFDFFKMAILSSSAPWNVPAWLLASPVVVVIKWRLWQQIKDLLMKKISQENRDPFITLHLNVQFWSAHHVHGTNLHPKRGSYELNSIKVKSFAITNVNIIRVP